MAVTQFTLPNTLSRWPYKRHLNPHYDEVAPQSSRWAESFNAFDARAQRAFNRCDFGKLASLAFPFHDRVRARTACDLMNLFFIIDEHSDVEGELVVRQMADTIMDALRNPHKPRPEGEWVGGEATRQFWELAIQTATTSARRRFVETFDEYMDAVVQQAEDREKNHIRSLESYLEVRRGTIGAKPSFAIMELEMDLSDEVFNHPTLQNLRLWAIDMLCIGNDICSYNVEQARGDDLHNIVTIVMHELDTDIQGAMNHIGELHDCLVDAFLFAKDRLPSFGECVDAQVARYVHGLGNWVRAGDQWSFESQRYFGTKGLEIMEHRAVNLLPKVVTSGITINIPSADQIAPAIAPVASSVSTPLAASESYASRVSPRAGFSGGKMQWSIRERSTLVSIVLTGLFVIYITVSFFIIARARNHLLPLRAGDIIRG